ncbi:MAG: RtcB family protein [Myxococcales bacterium]|nr:RtcB family protein [Myxococcales bacterium]
MDLEQLAAAEWRQVGEFLYQLDAERIPGGRVPVRIVGDEQVLARAQAEGAASALIEASRLPGTVGFAVGFPNLGERWGFPAGAVLATEYPSGALVPSAVGPDVNCGLRLLSSPLGEGELMPRLHRLLDELEWSIPIGVERGGTFALSRRELEELLAEGSRYLVREKGVGRLADLWTTDAGGHFHDADAEHLSGPAKSAGLTQLGTLGTGRSHFVEVEVVDRLYDEAAAGRLGLGLGKVALLLHAGARRLGQRTYEEAVEHAHHSMEERREKEPRPGLVWAPLSSMEGLRCYHALRAAANYAFANRHVLTHQARLAFHRVFGGPPEQVLEVAYDSAANVVGVERLGEKVVCMHRRAAVGAFGPGRDSLPHLYRDIGQPVLLPGSMGAHSYVMLAQEAASELCLASACHGTGRVLSRRLARKGVTASALLEGMEKKGVLLRSPAAGELREEAPEAYREVDRTAEILERAGVARKVARLRPRAVLKG